MKWKIFHKEKVNNISITTITKNVFVKYLGTCFVLTLVETNVVSHSTIITSVGKLKYSYQCGELQYS